jgi:hypothetical protein
VVIEFVCPAEFALDALPVPLESKAYALLRIVCGGRYRLNQASVTKLRTSSSGGR